MAKRFIDTGLFDDQWFMEASKDAKIFWLYCITKCNHAGILELNEKLCKFQTGITSLEKVYKELGNRLVTLKQPYIFIPKFLSYQYPNFPNSNVKAQQSAIKELIKYGVYDEKKQTLTEGLSNSYEYGYGYGNGNGNGNGKKQEEKKEIEIPTIDEFVKYAKEKDSTVKESAVRLKYEAWKENKWKDGNGKKISNWKSKLLNTIPYMEKNKSQQKTINSVWDKK